MADSCVSIVQRMFDGMAAMVQHADAAHLDATYAGADADPSFEQREIDAAKRARTLTTAEAVSVSVTCPEDISDAIDGFLKVSKQDLIANDKLQQLDGLEKRLGRSLPDARAALVPRASAKTSAGVMTAVKNLDPNAADARAALLKALKG